MKITLLIPTWNEIVGMKAIMPKIKPEWYDQLIILDGGSTDGTIEYATEHGYQVHIQKLRGLRKAYGEVLPLIQGDVLITFSPDGNCIPEILPELIRKMREGYDMVVVSRYLDGAKSEDDDLVTGFGNWLFTAVVNVLHGGHYTDAMGIYRAYKTKLIYDLELNQEEGFAAAEKLFCTNVSWEPLLSVRAVKSHLRVGEIPGDEPKRLGGERKLQVLKWGAVFLFQFIREMFVWQPLNKKRA